MSEITLAPDTDLGKEEVKEERVRSRKKEEEHQMPHLEAYDIYKGRWESVDGRREFAKQGKPIRTGVKIPADEAVKFNVEREGVENNVLTERLFPVEKTGRK